MEKVMDCAKRAKNWIFQDKHRQQADETLQALKRAFSEHPAEVNENYFQHLFFTAWMSVRLFISAVALFIHGLFPFLFVRTASNEVARLYAIMRARIPKDRRSQFESRWDENG